jgi:hypothetical protein
MLKTCTWFFFLGLPALDFAGIWLDREGKHLEMVKRNLLTPQKAQGRQFCLMVQANKTKE